MAGKSLEDLTKEVKRKRSGAPSLEDLTKEVTQRRYSQDVSKVDDAYVKSFFDDAGSFFTDSQKELEGMTWESANSYAVRDRQYAKSQDLGYRANLINYYLENNKDRLDSESYASLSKALSDYQSGFSQVGDSYAEARKYYSQWDSDESYQTAVRYDGYNKQYSGLSSGELTDIIGTMEDGEEKDWLTSFAQMTDYEEKKNADIGALQSEIDALETVYKEAEAIALNSLGLGGDEEDARLQEQISNILSKAGNGEYSRMTDLEKAIDQKTAYLNTASRIQKGIELASVADTDPEFSQYSAYVDGGKTPWYKIPGYEDIVYGLINGDQDAKNGITMATAWGKLPDHKKARLDAIQYMTDEEKALYNYYYNKHGYDAAEEYLDSIIDGLNQLHGADMFQDLEGNRFAEMAFGVAAGFDQANSGLQNLFSDKDYIPTSATQYASGMVREDFDTGFGKGAYDLVTTTANMLPSIMVSVAVGAANPALGSLAGNALMGASAAGNAYASAINSGYDKKSARFYSTCIGASEVALGQMIGGISKLGGITPALKKALSGIDSGIARFALQYGGQMVSEGIEEGLQEILDPLLQNAILNADESIDWSEVAYSALLGGLTAGLMEGPGTVVGAVTDAKLNKDAVKQYGEFTGDLIQEGLLSDPSSESYKLAQKYQKQTEAGKAMTGRQIRQQVQANEAQFAVEDYNSAVKTAKEKLTQLGETENVDKIAELAAKKSTGQELTRTEKSTLARSQYGAQVAEEMATAVQQTNVNDNANKPSVGAETAETTGGQIVAEAQNEAQRSQVAAAEPEKTTVAKTATVEAQKEAAPVAEESSVSAEATATLDEASKKYGAQAKAMIHTYQAGQDVAKFDAAYQAAYDMGKSGVSISYAMKSTLTQYLTEGQRDLAYQAGEAAANTAAHSRQAEIEAAGNGKTGRKKGVVRGDGVTISDLKKTFNDTQGKAYKYLSYVAEVTGIDIVLYRSEADADGNFHGAQGKYDRNDPGTIYIDLNAGLLNIKSVDDLAKYAMLRTFAHDFSHFIENWNPVQYNEFRKVVFDTLTQRGENVHDLIEQKQAQNPGMSYNKASREVVAEAMTDILPDANFVQELAEKHKNIFTKLLEKLKEFVQNLRDYFNSIGHNRSREANALKEQVGDTVKYLDTIVKMWDRIAVQAVENYQKTVATEIDGGIASGTREEVSHRGDAESPGRVGKENAGGEGSARERCERRIKEILREKILSANKARTPGRGRVETKETRADFESRVRNDGLMYVETAGNALAFKVATTQSKNASIAASTLGKFGFDVVVFDGSLQRNGKGVTETSDAGTMVRSAGKLTIFISAELDIDGMETAYHEGFHAARYALFAKHHDKIANIIADNVDAGSESFAQFVSEIADLYAYTESDVSPKKFEAEIIEEFYAWFVGKLYETESGDMQVYMAQFSDMEAIKKQIDGEYASMEKNADKALPGLFDIDMDDGPTAEDPAEQKQTDPVEATEAATEAPAQPDAYTSLADRLNQYTHVDIDGIRYSAKAKKEGGYYGNIKRLPAKAGGVPIENARSTIYSSYTPGFATREEAIADLVAMARNNKLLGEIQAAEKQEVTDNGENVDNAGAVQQPELHRQGDARLLDEVEAGDVPGDGAERDAVGSAAERGQPTVRDGGRPGERAGDGSGHGDGSSESGDLRRDDGLTNYESAKAYAKGKGYRIELNKLSAKKHIIQVDIYDKQGLPTLNPIVIGELGKDKDATKWNQVKEAIDKREAEDKAKAEQFHEEVVEQIEQQSTEQPKGRNFVIGDSLDLPSGEKSRYKANVEAIRLVKKLEAEGRYATEAEQMILSKYVGWGGLANAFDQRKTDWAKEFKELQELLSEEEYASARGSTLNAHYTEISVIKAMYDGLKHLGFTGGRMMEPSSGVGNFVGAMPADMAANVRSWTMVELDGITGLIAKYLYPNADVRIQGFEKANIPSNFMDVAIGNVPFGNYAIADKSYPKKVTSAIHNYFFAKSLDKVRPGGIVMFITSSYTMNSSDTTVRRYIMQKADLLGAIRLPDTAFKGNAGTEVVTDILVLKKRADNTNYAGEDFLEAPYTRPIAGNWSGAYINDYFNNHPEMVLGTASFTGSMYRGDNLTYKALENRGSLADQIREAFKHIQGKMDYPAQLSPEKTNFAVERAGKKTKENGLVVKDGKVYKNINGELIEQKVAKGAAERISGMLEIRDAAKALQNAQQQGLKEAEIKKARQKLNNIYDAFVKKNGFINAQANRNAIKDDPDNFSILALENWDSENKKATKSDIFSKNTIAANRTVTSAKDVSEGLIVSINQTGGVDAALIAKLTGKTVEDVTRELIDSRAVFKNRDGGLETAEVYLSGNVRAKLRDAEAMVPMDADYQKNVEALKAVMPEDVGYQDIFVNPGTPWIPDSVYSDFAAHMLGGRNTDWRKDVTVTRNKDTGNFTVELGSKYLKMNAANTQKWGTSRRSFLDLFDAMLNSKSVVVKYKTDDGKTVVDKDATAAANEKIENIQKEFQEWLWKDETRRTELATLYNETFNSIVTPKYNGDNLTVNGANAMKPLRPHQRNAVQRIIASGGNTLLAHKVGAGKTYEMAAAAMKLKQLGLVKKPMFAVPKSLVAQWGNEFKDFFPTAKLLVAEASDFTAANRKVFMNRIANGDYDAVIVSYEQFERLPVSNDFARELYQEQIDSIIWAIEEAKAEKGGKSLSVKDLEKKRKQLQTKIEKLTDSAKDEGNIDFEQLGVDSIFVDEAHNFKNLFYTTSMTNVSGLGNKDGSKRAFDLYTKVRYLQKLNGGRGIVFATATPVMNSMSEMYIMQKYLQPDLLDQLGLSTFDAWAKQFGEVVNGVEIKPSGQGYRVKQSFSRFKNMSELQLLFRNFADVLTDIPGLKIPKMKGGKVNVVVCEPGQFQQDYMKELEKRADNVKNVDPSVDNMLKITSDGRKISYTQRMIDPSLPYEEGCKIYRCADNVLAKYQEYKEIKGTQIIFCDMATPKGKSNTANAEAEEIETDMESAKLYDDIKARLMKGGIPAKEIAFIHEADTDAKKKKLFQDVNDGKVRVLIGSTGKMGVGMNAQKRIVAIHHLDAPWRPGDVEQRNGRAYRQGNINDEVENFTYVTEGSFDARLWDILERKQNFINQVMNGENVGRETEDTGEVTLSAAEVKALASGSPLIMEQVQLDTDIKKLESLYRAHRSAVAQAKQNLEADKGTIEMLNKRIASGKKDVAARVDTYSEDKFSITVGKQKFTDKKEAGTALMAEATAKATEERYTTIGKFAGFELRVIKTHEGIKGLISGNQGYPFNTYPGNTTYMINHLVAKVEAIEETLKLWEHTLSETRKDMAEQEKLITQPFAKQAELDQKRARYNEVMEILNPKEEQALDSMDEDTVQEQSREYLGEDTVQNQQRTDTLTDREVLAIAASEVKVAELNPAEQDALRIFQERLGKLEALQEERAEQGRLYKEQQFGAKVNRAAAAQTLNRMRTLDAQIQKASADVLSVEEKAVLKEVLHKARKVVEKQQWSHDQEILDRWRDRRKNSDAIKKYRQRLTKDVNDLTNWVLSPNNKDVVKHIPDVLKNSVIPFLSSIDFTSKQQLRGGPATQADKEFMKRLNGLKAALKPNQSIDGLYGDYSDLPPNFMDRLQQLIDTAQAIVEKNSGEFVVNQMTSDELKELSQVVRTLKEYIQNFNKFHANAMFQHVSEAGDSTIEELGGMKNASDKTGTVSNFVFWQQIRPAYAWERFGAGGKAIYDGLRRGQAKLAFNTKEIQAFAEKAYTEAEVKAWEKEIKEIPLGGDIVKMSVPAIMSFYELSKRPQALGHILGAGVRVATYKANGKKISDVGHKVEPGDVQTIIGMLSDRQKEVADALQKFMQEQGGKWGNFVSVKRFGEELFGEDHYFPINSDGRHLAANADEHPGAASLYALLNMGFTKATTEGANNRIVLYNIFDVFANHMASMAQYNAFALPVVDAIKWFNYQQKSEPDEDGHRYVLGSVRDQMDRVYGVPEETRPGSGKKGYAQNFVINILKAFNGTEAQGVPTDTWGMNMLRQYNMAQVAFNLRVVVQQPLAITRAALLVDYGSIIKGMKLKPAAIRQNIQEMQRYSGIAAWKGLGFYDVNISRGLTDIIKHSSTVRDKINEVGMWGAEKADLIAWAGIWSSCKEEVIKKQGLKPSSEGFYEAVTQLFEDVIYKTQVVDSVLTKNEYMRSKGFFARAMGSFMSEPTTTASMLINAVDKFNADMQHGMSRQQAWKKNGKMIVRTAYVYGLSAVILAAVQAAADAFRDDDDYQDFLEKWLEAFGGNLVDELMPLNKLPILTDAYELAKELLSIWGVDTYGNPPQSVWMQWYDSLVKGVQILNDKIKGEDTNYTWYGGAYKLLQAASGMIGLPMAAATREIVTSWNNIVGGMAPSLKIKTYEPGEKNEIKYAYQDGYLTYEEAVEQLLEKGLVDNEDEAYWTIQGWEAGDGYSRYEAIYDAVRNGGDISEAMRELTSHGYKEKDVLSQVKEKIGKWYTDGEITKQQATNMLSRYLDMDSEEITATVNKWSCKVVTGIAYNDIKDEYMDGNITASRAIEMRMRYGGQTEEEARADVQYWAFQKKYPKYKDVFTSSNVAKYHEFAEPAGISVDVYAQFINGTKGLATIRDEWGDEVQSKREQVLEVIDSLPLTWQQKNALYLAAGYSENKMWDVPW